MSKRAFSEIRTVEVTFKGNFSPDGYKAAINKVEELEDQYLNNPDLEDLQGVKIAITGTSRYRLYVFNVDTKISSGLYNFAHEETVPNADSISA